MNSKTELSGNSKQRARNLPHIGLLFNARDGFFGGVFRGIVLYSSIRPWVLEYVQKYATLSQVKDWSHAGIIARVVDTAWAAGISRLGKPIVNISNANRAVHLPHVGVNDEEVGRVAARHFLERGFKHFGFVGEATRHFSVQREAGFREVLQTAGYTCDSIYMPEYVFHQTHPWKELEPGDIRIQKRLQSWHKPVAFFASSDDRAWYVTRMCNRIGLHVPEEVAVVGVNNDSLICETSHPPLSSVMIPGEKIGYAAAELLSSLLAGANPPTNSILFPPLGVITRHSSDILAIEDENVAAAVRFIREHLREPISVESILQQVAISRRALERRFRDSLGRSPHDEIRRVRLETAKELLTRTDLPMPEVARQSGFHTIQRLSIVFKQNLSIPPSQYRKQFRVFFRKE